MSGGRWAWLSCRGSLQHSSRGWEFTATALATVEAPLLIPLESVKPFFPLCTTSPSISAPQCSGHVLLLLSLTSASMCSQPSAKALPAPSPWRTLGSAAFPSSAEAGAVAQTIWFLTASRLSAPRCRVAVKLTAPVVSLHSACRKLLLEVVVLELPYRLQKYQLYSCMPFQIIPLEKLVYFFFLITVSYFSFIDLNIIAYLLWLHFKEPCLFVCNYPQVF